MTDAQKMISILDDRQAIMALDKSGALASAESLADQVRDTYEHADDLDLGSLDLKNLENIVVAGMGGSALGADVVKHLFEDQLALPFLIQNQYQLPAFVNQKTLLILSSYSGSTEEVLACAEEAEQKKAQIVVISAGGKLLELAKEKKYPFFQIKAKYNPSNQPRMAIGYSIMATILILKKAALLQFGKEELNDVLNIILQVTQNSLVEVEQEKNQAKLLALMAVERRSILIAAQFLQGAVHVATNQFNENAKSFADFKIIPEINHHLLEGLQFPKSNPYSHLFIFFQSKLYHPRIQKRLLLTQELIEAKEMESLLVELKAESRLAQVFELITLMTFANLYLAFIEKVNPSPIPSVDWFKAELGKN